MERNILKFAKHPKYGQGGAYYDVAVAEADRIIEFTEYVRPVCLPMTPVDDEDALADDLVTLGNNIISNTSMMDVRNSHGSGEFQSHT